MAPTSVLQQESTTGELKNLPPSPSIILSNLAGLRKIPSFWFVAPTVPAPRQLHLGTSPIGYKAKRERERANASLL